MRMDLPTWFEHLEENLPYKEVQFRKFCLPVKTTCAPAENIAKTPPWAFTFDFQISKVYPQTEHSDKSGMMVNYR